MKLFLVLLILISGLAKGESKKKAVRAEYEASFQVVEGRQPVITIKWFSMNSRGAAQQYPQIWRKGMKFGYGNRLQVLKLTGVDYDGKQKIGEVVVAEILDTETKKTFVFRSDGNVFYKSYSKEWLAKHQQKYPPKKYPPK